MHIHERTPVSGPTEWQVRRGGRILARFTSITAAMQFMHEARREHEAMIRIDAAHDYDNEGEDNA